MVRDYPKTENKALWVGQDVVSSSPGRTWHDRDYRTRNTLQREEVPLISSPQKGADRRSKTPILSGSAMSLTVVVCP